MKQNGEFLLSIPAKKLEVCLMQRIAIHEMIEGQVVGLRGP